MTTASLQEPTADPIRGWRERLADERRAREERRKLMLGRLWEALTALEVTYCWREAFAFGSLARPGAFTRRSDVDVAVGGLAPNLHYRAVGELSHRLGIDVDLVRLEECRFADKIRSEGIAWKP
jgi:predicted nucleotidyltransferase